MNNLLVALIISSFWINASMAQESSNSDTPKKKRWSYAIYIGGNAGGPSDQIEDEMNKNGFNKTSSGGTFLFWSSSGSDYPYTTPGISWTMNVKYYATDRFASGILLGNTYYGSTHGYKESSLIVDYKAIFISPVISFNSFDILHIGAGPSLFFTKAWEGSGHHATEAIYYKKTKLGFLVDLGLRVPGKSRYFFELNILYKYVGKANIGPFQRYEDSDILPETKVNYNHFLISFGFGVRI